MAGGGATPLNRVSTASLPYYFTTNQVVEYGSTRYLFYINFVGDIVYVKSTDRGRSWGTPVTVHAANVARFSVWFDRWTPGDAGTVIHIWDIETGVDDVNYFSLDVSSDTLGNGGVGIVVFAGASVSPTGMQISGSKARGGNLLVVFNLDGGTEVGSYRSTDSGATWGVRADANEAAIDFYSLFPGNAADNQDMWLVYWDVSANEISLKTYDDSADSWSEASISTGMAEAGQTTVWSQMAGAVRASDNHLLLAAWNAYDSATGDLTTWDINGSGSITAKTDVVSNSADCILAALSIAADEKIYCTYAGKSDGSQTAATELGIYQKMSSDGMATWGSEKVIYSDHLGPVVVLMAAQQCEGSWPLIVWLNDMAGGGAEGYLIAAYQSAHARASSQIGV